MTVLSYGTGIRFKALTRHENYGRLESLDRFDFGDSHAHGSLIDLAQLTQYHQSLLVVIKGLFKVIMVP